MSTEGIFTSLNVEDWLKLGAKAAFAGASTPDEAVAWLAAELNLVTETQRTGESRAVQGIREASQELILAVEADAWDAAITDVLERVQGLNNPYRAARMSPGTDKENER